MSKSINILDNDYLQWIQALCKRYRQSQIKAATSVNSEMLRFYWSVGQDIVSLKAESRWGDKFMKTLSRDLKEQMPDANCFSPTNLLYMKNFYLIYHTLVEITPQPEELLTKDPYNFAFTGITKPYNERILKNALLNNITRFLTELGTGFAYVGKEYRLQVGQTENFIDLLFYNLNLSCYVVIEVKIGKFEFADIGQLGGYVVACNHTLRKKGRDNPTIGLLICKEKDKVQAQYALESSSQPLGISEYDLEKFYPEKVEGTIPTIEEIEDKLSDKTK